MQAVILAGGVGSRLEKATGGRPKCLVEIGGRPLILHQLDALADHGVGPVLMVVGYKHELIREAVGQRVEYLLNERYAETNSLYSLWLVREWVKGPFVLLNSDLFFEPEVLARLIEERGNVLAYDSTSSRGREQTKVAIRERRVMDLGKDLPPAAARGESLGLLKFDAEGARAMLQVGDDLVRQGHERAWVIEATRAVCRQVPIYGVNVAGLHWTEVDFPHDLEQARREVWPAIWRGRWRGLVYWKRTRWAAGGTVALALAVSGWLASARLGPASIDWESVAPGDAPRVALSLPASRQKWWVLPRGDSITVRLDEGGPVRVELRLVMPSTAADTARYVVGLTVDEHAHDLIALAAVGEPGVALDGAAVSDRNRVQLILPRGPHVVRVKYPTGDGDRLLVRVRRPE